MKSVSRRAIAFGAAILTAAALLTGLSLVSPAPADALTGSQFNPANIISDANFYNGYAMTQPEIQAFLQGKIGTCANSNCLNVKTTDTTTRPGDAMCSSYTGAAAESASTIIFKVQQACGISAKVLLVTLQKEQGLVTATNPTSAKLDRAMGYACPDSANGGCDPTYAGLYNQLYRAAWQFKRYGMSSTFNWYPVGSSSSIHYSPNAACGTVQVTIQNKATAALYYYTPYVPNAAALANLGGTGDACSAYGNRNFWVYYSTWFGSPTLPPGSPDGQLDVVTTTLGELYLSGWAFDRDALTSPLVVDIQIDGSWYQRTADEYRAVVAQDYPSAGTDHGFSGSFPMTPGGHTVCIYVQNIGAGGTLPLGCFPITTADGTPVGQLTAVTPTANTITLSGWAIDTDLPTTDLMLDVAVGSQWYSATANSAYAPAGVSYPSAGGSHGFSLDVNVPEGTYSVCVYAKNQGLGVNGFLGCSIVTVVSRTPIGALTAVTPAVGGITLQGWALDPDTLAAPAVLDIQLDAQWFALTANQANGAGETAFPGAGPNHGFAGTIPATGGTYTMCVYVKNSGAGLSLGLGCQTITVPGPVSGVAPVGALTSVSGAGGAVGLAGWAVDADAPAAALLLDVQLDGWKSLTANLSNPAGEAAVPGAGLSHGFSGSFAASPGAHTVCVYVKGQGAGGDLSLGCQVVTVVAAPAGVIPVGALVTKTGTGGVIALAGWAVDADVPTAAIDLDIQVDALWLLWTANGVAPAAAVAVPGAGQNHGFSGTVPVAAGNHTVCIYLKGQGGGANATLGCQVITVVP